MKLLLIVGSGAVGKMSVGQALMEKTKLRLLHNHMMIEPLIEIFGEHKGELSGKLRKLICEEFAKTDLYGLILTYLWAFNIKKDWDYIMEIIDIFEKNNASIYCVELVANQNIRLKRNNTPNRLRNKASKRDLEFSKNLILKEDKHYRLESFENEIPFKNYIKIDNSNLTPDEVADIVIKKFLL